MLKVILIDDEIVILQGLKKLINWTALGLEIVGEAMDGLEGLSLIEEKHPDIVISDITMPNLNGIEMLRLINEKKYKLKTIFLSGYQEFEFVQEAMHYGATDYLLKPVNEDNMIKVLNRISQEIGEERSYHYLRKQDSIWEQKFQELLLNKDWSVTIDKFCLLIKKEAICIGSKLLWKKEAVSKDDNLSIIKYEIYDYIHRIIEELGGKLIRKDNNAIYWIIQLDNRNELLQLINNIDELVTRKYPISMINGISCYHDSILEMYKSAKRALEIYYFEELKICYDVKKDYDIKLKTQAFKMEFDNLCQSIVVNRDSDLIVKEILNAISMLKEIHFGKKNAFINDCILLTGQIYALLNDCGLVNEYNQEEYLEFIENIRTKLTFSNMVKEVDAFYEQLFLKIQLLNNVHESSEIIKIKQYIDKHYHESITLEQLANYIGMNASYLSTFFKKETGQNFKSYLTLVRMKEAIRLLNSTDLKSYELANSVGYSDPKQFREKFKEVFGVSPQQYRKQKNNSL